MGDEMEGQDPANAPVDTTEQQGTAPEAPSGGHPAWAGYLADLPESVRPLVQPQFEEWDKGVQKKFQDIHSQYDPWKPVLETEYGPESVLQALALVERLNEDPQAVFKILQEAYGLDAGEQGAPEPEEDSQSSGQQFKDPRLDQIEQMTLALSDAFLAQEQAKELAEANRMLDSELASLREKYGNFDEDYVVGKIAEGADPEVAVGAFKDMLKQHLQAANSASASAPLVIGSGGGLPSQAVDPASLSTKETKNLVAQLLEQANSKG